jgi:hypothetical protein
VATAQGPGHQGVLATSAAAREISGLPFELGNSEGGDPGYDLFDDPFGDGDSNQGGSMDEGFN